MSEAQTVKYVTSINSQALVTTGGLVPGNLKSFKNLWIFKFLSEKREYFHIAITFTHLLYS